MTDEQHLKRKEYMKAYNKEYAKKHQARLREKNRAYRREYMRKRNAAKRLAGETAYTGKSEAQIARMREKARVKQAAFRARRSEEAIALERTRCRAWYAANVEKLKAKAAAYRARTLDERRAKWRTPEAKAKKAARLKAWREKNREKCRAGDRARWPMYSRIPRVRILHSLRQRLRDTLRSDSAVRVARSIELFGAPAGDIKVHLEQQFRDGMTWDNYGKCWHIDHIRPCASYDLTQPEQQRDCFHFSNLQPLLVCENLTKHASFQEEAA